MSKFIGNSITLPNLAAAPSSPVQGDMYYNTVDDTVYVYDGASWLDLAAAGGGGGGATWSSYTPTFGGGFSIGNGTVVAKHAASGKVVFGKIDITIGSTTTLGTGLTATLPSTPINTVGGEGIVKRYTRAYPVYVHYNDYTSPVSISLSVDSDGQTHIYTDIAAEIPSYNDLENLKTYTFANSIPDAVLIRNSRPIGFAQGDIIEVSFFYEVA
jgi:hypothetical protein